LKSCLNFATMLRWAKLDCLSVASGWICLQLCCKQYVDMQPIQMRLQEATSPADEVGIMMKVFPADEVGIQVISCSVLHILPLLWWESCSKLLHNTNPAAKCQQKLFRSATDTVGFVCSSGTRDVHDGKRSISYQASTTRSWQNWTPNRKPKLPIPNVRRPAGAGASQPTIRSWRCGGAALRVRLRLNSQTTRRRPSSRGPRGRGALPTTIGGHRQA
jgi:hypothetical protein